MPWLDSFSSFHPTDELAVKSQRKKNKLVGAQYEQHSVQQIIDTMFGMSGRRAQSEKAIKGGLKIEEVLEEVQASLDAEASLAVEEVQASLDAEDTVETPNAVEADGDVGETADAVNPVNTVEEVDAVETNVGENAVLERISSDGVEDDIAIAEIEQQSVDINDQALLTLEVKLLKLEKAEGIPDASGDSDVQLLRELLAKRHVADEDKLPERLVFFGPYPEGGAPDGDGGEAEEVVLFSPRNVVDDVSFPEQPAYGLVVEFVQEEQDETLALTVVDDPPAYGLIQEEDETPTPTPIAAKLQRLIQKANERAMEEDGPTDE